MEKLANDPVIGRMQALVQKWEQIADQRCIFLSCYLRMTSNMLKALAQGEFHDAVWVDRLLRRFAGYYFEALDAYEQAPQTAPAVWILAHDQARRGDSPVLQKLMLGVNAHINYDLVLTLEELLQSEWSRLTPEQRLNRYADHCHVNDVIGRTIDEVQDEILEPRMPLLELIDQVLGPVDEKLVSKLISHWREQVWRNALRLLDTEDEFERSLFIREVEQAALQIGILVQRI